MELLLPDGYVSSSLLPSPCLRVYRPMPPLSLTDRLCAAFNIPYEITAIDVLLGYWTDKIPIEAVVVVCLVIYAYVQIPTRYAYFSKSQRQPPLQHVPLS
jgi:hypothetical protein